MNIDEVGRLTLYAPLLWKGARVQKNSAVSYALGTVQICLSDGDLKRVPVSELEPLSAYDAIDLADNEWGNDLMREIAQVYFAAHPDCEFVKVHEHGGWFLGFRRDLSIWATANDAAVMDGGPRPETFSGNQEKRI